MIRRIIIISFYNALIELVTAVQSIGTCIWWMLNGCTVEYTVSDEDGNIIHFFPQLNYDGDDDDF